MVSVFWPEAKVTRRGSSWRSGHRIWRLSMWICAYVFASLALAMNDEEIKTLRKDTIDLFYHGFDNYMSNAFPEDELRPISCAPLTRDQEDPGHFAVNDALGNYSLTLVDSLSTLAILASASPESLNGRHPFEDFKSGVADFVHLYGDGSIGPSGQGTKSRGFDLDSKVQVFETVIRGVGGLLSAHLFAEGHLPIAGYKPFDTSPNRDLNNSKESKGVRWSEEFTYDGQLLRLAQDLGYRLLPAFYTVTGLPYPRVNLRYGVPFYDNSPLNENAEHGQCHTRNSEHREVTETCSAGAGSLVLEFTVLSRLTGDPKFETFAKKAFQAVWERKSSVGLVGSGIDAESGNWLSPFTGIGAGVDSFFEYAMKGHILLSQTDQYPTNLSFGSSRDFLEVWQQAHQGIKRHLYRSASFKHPHYIQGDLFTGASKAFWIDSLSAYYPGLLTLSGELEEAIETHLLYTALWTRYSALPERWNAASGNIDNNLRWWGGRPEFIESTWYLYRATQDPWYLHVGEMVIKDIRRRCWTKCGWAGLEDVRDGEMKDRMESFFLGETAKYSFLLFDPSHPLNHVDDAIVFTTEGHPLIIPKESRRSTDRSERSTHTSNTSVVAPTCPTLQSQASLGFSSITTRSDFFHPVGLARLHLIPTSGIAPQFAMESSHNESSNFSKNSLEKAYVYPWTLPMNFLPPDGFSSPMENRKTFDLSFPTFSDAQPLPLRMIRTDKGIVINSISGLKFGLIKEIESGFDENGHHMDVDIYRVYTVSHLSLGRDEKVFLTPGAIASLDSSDPFLTRHRDLATLDIVLDLSSSEQQGNDAYQHANAEGFNQSMNASMLQNLLQYANSVQGAHGNLEAMIETIQAQMASRQPWRSTLVGSAATGVGAGLIPEVSDTRETDRSPFTWQKIFIADEACETKIDPHVPREYQVLIIKRGGCNFSQKLRNIPSFPPGHNSLQLVIIVSGFEEGDGAAVRPLLDEIQFGSSGILRRNPIAMVMIEGGEGTLEALRNTKSIGIRRRYYFSSQGISISNLFMS